MRNFFWAGILAAMTIGGGTAWAETFSGTITTVDEASGQFMLSRADTEKNVAVAIKNRAILEKLHPGTEIILDADRNPIGIWEARSLATTGLRFRAPDDSVRVTTELV